MFLMRGLNTKRFLLKSKFQLRLICLAFVIYWWPDSNNTSPWFYWVIPRYILEKVTNFLITQDGQWYFDILLGVKNES